MGCQYRLSRIIARTMAVISDSSFSLVPLSTQPSSTAPPVTIMYSTTGAPSTISEIGSYSASPSLTTEWPNWVYLELMFNNPYTDPCEFMGTYPDEMITPNSYELSVWTRCGNLWTSTFVDWIYANGGNSLSAQAYRTYCNTNSPATLPQSLWDPKDCRTILGYASLPFSYTAPRDPPCCHTCTFTAGDAQVYHWPVVTDSPSITELVNTAGFTLYVFLPVARGECQH